MSRLPLPTAAGLRPPLRTGGAGPAEQIVEPADLTSASLGYRCVYRSLIVAWLCPSSSWASRSACSQPWP
jgi:hypothetical protein